MRQLLMVLLLMMGISWTVVAIAAELPLPPEMKELQEKMKTLERAKTISPQKKATLKKECSALNGQFQQVWKPLQEVYNEMKDAAAKFDGECRALEDKIAQHNEAQPQTPEEVPAHEKLTKELNDQLEALRERFSQRHSELVKKMDERKESVEQWLENGGVKPFTNKLGRLTFREGTALRQLKRVNQGQGKPYFAPEPGKRLPGAPDVDPVPVKSQKPVSDKAPQPSKKNR